MSQSVVFKLLALLLASNYLAFHIEPFEDEYEANHRPLPDGYAFSKPSMTWETFDKQNAPKAFVFDAALRIQFLHPRYSPQAKELLAKFQYQPVRDKSPPSES